MDTMVNADNWLENNVPLKVCVSSIYRTLPSDQRYRHRNGPHISTAQQILLGRLLGAIAEPKVHANQHRQHQQRSENRIVDGVKARRRGRRQTSHADNIGRVHCFEWDTNDTATEGPPPAWTCRGERSTITNHTTHRF